MGRSCVPDAVCILASGASCSTRRELRPEAIAGTATGHREGLEEAGVRRLRL